MTNMVVQKFAPIFPAGPFSELLNLNDKFTSVLSNPKFATERGR
ncbi:hypothetical protein V1291_005397 [Nitrobacteraceae bacterium AZCC 1564]